MKLQFGYNPSRPAPMKNRRRAVDKQRSGGYTIGRGVPVRDWPSGYRFRIVTVWVAARRLLLFIMSVRVIPKKRDEGDYHKDNLTNLGYRQCDRHTRTPFHKGAKEGFTPYGSEGQPPVLDRRTSPPYSMLTVP